MKCNCNNINGGALEKPKISHVYGNVLRIAIPLTLRTVEKVNDEMVATDTDFIPSNEYPVKVVFAKSALKYSLDATMNGNIAYVEDKGKIPLGTYDITVTCNDDNGNPYRFNQATVLQVVNSTKEAGIETPIEYEVTTWYLDAAIYLALKGEDGVGIEDIRTETSDEIGGMNTVTIYLTDGRTKSFSVMNGSGSVDNILNILSHHPISNSAVTAKFNEIDERLIGLFGDVDYDSQSKQIRFWDKGKTSVLARLDARPFIKDGMVSNVYISNNTLVITFNTDSGREAIGVPLSSVFNPNNYYTKTQVDNRIASLLENYYNKTQIDNKLSDKANINGDWVQDFTASCFNLWCTERNDGLAVKIDADVDHSPDSAFIVFIDEYNYGGMLIYVFPQDTETRHIATEEYVQEYVSEHGDDGDSLVQVQSDWNQTDTSAVDYIKNKPTIPTIPTNVSYFTNDAGYLTQHQDISGKADKATTYTKTETDNAIANAVEGLGGGSVESVTINGFNHEPINGVVDLGTIQDGADGITPHIGQDGYWYIGSTNTGVKAEGTQGNSGVASADGIVSVNNLNGGTTDTAQQVFVLGANMGKELALLIQSYEDRLDALEEAGGFIAQVVGTKLILSRTTDPMVIVGQLSRSTVEAKAGQTQSALFFLSGRNLEGNITIELSDSTNFSLPVSAFTPTNGKVATTAVVVNYTPASGTAAGTIQPCNVTIKYNNVVYSTLALSGTVVESTSLEVSPLSVQLIAEAGNQVSGTIHIDGTALDADVTLAITGTTGFSFASGSILTSKTIAKADAEAGIDVPVYYTAGNANESGSITVSTTGVADITISLQGKVATPLAVGSYFDVPIPAGGALRYTVLDAILKTVSVQGVQYNDAYPTSTLAEPLVIPSTVSDASAVGVYDSGGTEIDAGGMTYNVTTIPQYGFRANNGKSLISVYISDGITLLDKNAFLGAYLEEVRVPAATVKQYAFAQCDKLKKIILADGATVKGGSFDIPQFAGTSDFTPVVINLSTGANVQRINYDNFNVPFRRDSNGKVHGILYYPDAAQTAYETADNGWTAFLERHPLSDYDGDY